MRKSIAFLALILIASTILGACAPAATQTPAAQAPAQTPAPQGSGSGSIQINGAGATFPFPLYSRWFYEYAYKDPTVKFNYQSIGSGGGIKQITSKTVDFAGSDAILTDEQYAAAPGIHMYPSVAGAVLPTYSISELKDADPLVFDGPTLADIFLGKIKKWNDPAIAKLNPKAALPDKDIIVVHRSDGSGTSFIFTSYLAAVSDEWKTTVGASSSVQWPVGLGGKGNEGVSGTVGQNDGSIGYVELAYAKQNKLAMAKMLNAAGNTVEANADTTQSAMNDFVKDMPDSLTQLIVNGPGANSWPIAGYTYLLLYTDQTDCAKAAKLLGFIRWALADGSEIATQLDYVPLPDAVQEKDLAALGQITCNGQPIK